ncbi:MAG: hypothetical protein BZY88_14620 [SAR202 cluster bacterium Io17-Chloro-G9]|nr:MAG: hypothetical protein BZY88_14620 [SAR202 cluster bacterium Io17-Chloro-G9]
MDIFISWSGPTSEAIAQALRDWLPKVIQSLRPWMSAADIEKGTRWSMDIARRLEEAKVGIICLTPDNLSAPWIMFEAGALSKTIEGTYVIPYLFQVTPSQMEGPLTQFQAVKAEEEETKELILTINRALGDNALPESQLAESFDVWWPRFNEALLGVPSEEETHPLRRPDRDLLEEILSLTRMQARERSLPSAISPGIPDGIKSVRREGHLLTYEFEDGMQLTMDSSIDPGFALRVVRKRQLQRDADRAAREAPSPVADTGRQTDA